MLALIIFMFDEVSVKIPSLYPRQWQILGILRSRANKLLSVQYNKAPK